jgi:uncharacterized RDD family membrane protein YckC
MLSPRCPCGYETRAGFRPLKPARFEDPPITVVVQNETADVDAARWRSQLDKKFETSHSNPPDIGEVEDRIDELLSWNPEIRDKNEPRRSASQHAVAETLADQVFGRRSPTSSAAPPNTGLRGREQSSDTWEDGSAEPEPMGLPRPVAIRPASPEQKSLTLEPLTADTVRRKIPHLSDLDEVQEVSREILFSRVLAAILDLLLPIAVAMLFVFAASWVVGSDFFSPQATRTWAILAGALYFLGGFYFFWIAGQTPGMHVAELKLVGADGKDPGFGRVLVRMVLFLPVLATVVGLILAFFDPECRAVHDRLSGTKVVSSALE